MLFWLCVLLPLAGWRVMCLHCFPPCLPWLGGEPCGCAPSRRADPGWVPARRVPACLVPADPGWVLRDSRLCPLLLRSLQVRRAGVNVFGMASRKESLILQLKVSAGAATGFF